MRFMNFTTCNSKSYTAPSLTITEYEIEQGFSLSYTEIETTDFENENEL